MRSFFSVFHIPQKQPLWRCGKSRIGPRSAFQGARQILSGFFSRSHFDERTGEDSYHII